MGNQWDERDHAVKSLKGTAIELMGLCSWLADECDAGDLSQLLDVAYVRGLQHDLEMGNYSLRGAVDSLRDVLDGGDVATVWVKE